MSFQVRITKKAREDLRRLNTQLVARDAKAARRASEIIRKSMKLLEDFPFTCRKAAPNTPRIRELIIPFGHYGYVALFKITDSATVTVIAVRHQREDDFY